MMTSMYYALIKVKQNVLTRQIYTFKRAISKQGGRSMNMPLLL